LTLVEKAKHHAACSHPIKTKTDESFVEHAPNQGFGAFSPQALRGAFWGKTTENMKVSNWNHRLCLRTLLSAIILAVPSIAGLAANLVLTLDGTSGYVSVPDSPELRLSSGDFSIMAWVYLANYNSLNSAILTKREPGSQHGWMLYVGGAVQAVEARKPTFIVSESTDPRVVATVELGTNQWHHIAVVFHSSNSLAQLYLDGILNATGSLPQPLATTTNLFIGQDTKASDYFWNGNLDEIKPFGVTR
jgi:Concanavalin A-like lectin/glucanases superfamily